MPHVLSGMVQRVSSLGPLPTLSPEEYRQASSLIEEVVRTVVEGHLNVCEHAEDLARLIRDLRRVGDSSAAELVATHAAHALREAGNTSVAADMYKVAGLSAHDQGIFETAIEYYSQALDLLAGGDPRFLRPSILNNMGNALTELGRFQEAMETYHRALGVLAEAPEEAFREAYGETREVVVGTVMNNIGWTHLRQARTSGKDRVALGSALRTFRQALQGRLRPRTRIIASANLAEACLLAGDLSTAERLLLPLEAECVQLRVERVLPEVYRRKAQLCAARGEVHDALFWSRKALQASLSFTNPRQELRAVDICFELLRDLLAREGDRVRALEDSGSEILHVLVDLLESKDTYTGGDHSRRVASLSRRLASSLDVGDDQRFVRVVEMAGLLHDIGKLTIPWSLLNRLRPLSPEEVRRIRAHAQAGESLLEELGLPELAKVAGQHHERPDGKGYPRGLRTMALESALVAVADAYEAMTSPSRPYRTPKRVREAVEEVAAASGTQFVPVAVQALESVVLRRTRA